MFLLDVGSRECGMTQKATKGLLIRICPSFVRLYIEKSWLDPYGCDDVSPDARSGRTSDHKSHTTANGQQCTTSLGRESMGWGPNDVLASLKAQRGICVPS